ncbi:hypothetical protein GCM10010381_13510 [Streptomyces xantholiticus]|nr:hypothetical protein GCM10010381_13510 [Streptomyces xantholiticus]
MCARSICEIPLGMTTPQEPTGASTGPWWTVRAAPVGSTQMPFPASLLGAAAVFASVKQAPKGKDVPDKP